MHDITFHTNEPLVFEDAKVIDAGLDEFNGAAADFSGVVPFTSTARDDAGTIVGGVIARRWGQCCEIQQMWVDESQRSSGIGSRLMEQVDAHARDNGCSLIYLETFSFQAPEFYAKHGFTIACQFDGFAEGVSKFIMHKTLC